MADWPLSGSPQTHMAVRHERVEASSNIRMSTFKSDYYEIKKEEKQFLYRPGQALGVPGG